MCVYMVHYNERSGLSSFPRCSIIIIVIPDYYTLLMYASYKIVENIITIVIH